MTDPKPGDLVRITNHFLPTGTVATIEGRFIEQVHRGSVRLEGEVFAHPQDSALAWPPGAYVQVTVEILEPALPTTPGSVIRASCHPRCAAGTTPRLLFLGERGGDWRTEFGDKAVIENQPVEIVFDAGASS